MKIQEKLDWLNRKALIPGLHNKGEGPQPTLVAEDLYTILVLELGGVERNGY